MRTILILAALATTASAGGYRRCYTTTRYREPTVVVQQNTYQEPRGDAITAFAEKSIENLQWRARADAVVNQLYPTGGGAYAGASADYGSQAGAYAQTQLPIGNTVYSTQSTLQLREPFDPNAYMARAQRFQDNALDLADAANTGAQDVAREWYQAETQAATIEALRRTIETQNANAVALAQATKPKDVTHTVTTQSNSQWAGKVNTSPEIASPGARYEIAALSSGLVAFQQSCVGCHSGDEPKGGLDLSGELSPEVRWKAIAALASGKMPLADSPQAAAMDGPTKTAINQWLLSQWEQ